MAQGLSGTIKNNKPAWILYYNIVTFAAMFGCWSLITDKQMATIEFFFSIESNVEGNALYACKLENFDGEGFCRVLKQSFYILHKNKSPAGEVRLDSGWGPRGLLSI